MGNDAYDWEEHTHARDSKHFRKERKRLSQKDRSKYKKTDLDKRKKEPPKRTDLPRGRVLAISPDGILVDSEGKLYTCALKGSLKQEQQRIKNLVAVGDYVQFEPIGSEEGSIALIEERRSVLSRAEHLKRRKE